MQLRNWAYQVRATGKLGYAQFLSCMRRFEESLAQAEIARRLDPVSPDTSVHSAEPYLDAGRVDEAIDRKSTRLNSSHGYISYAVFCLKKKNTHIYSSAFSLDI